MTNEAVNTSVNPSGHKDIDHQVVIDLFLGNSELNEKNQGWGYRKIANHFGCSGQNIRNHIKGENAKREKLGEKPLQEIRGTGEKVKAVEVPKPEKKEKPKKEKKEKKEKPKKADNLEDLGEQIEQEAADIENEIEKIPEVEPKGLDEEEPANPEQPEPIPEEEGEQTPTPDQKTVKERLMKQPAFEEIDEAAADTLVNAVFSEMDLLEYLKAEYDKEARMMRNSIIEALDLPVKKTCSNEDFTAAVEAFREGV